MKELSFKQALIGFILPLIAVISLVATGNNIVIALFSAVLVEVLYCLSLGFKWAEIDSAIMDGASGMLGALLIMILVGIMIGVWMGSGTIPALLFYGMQAINPTFFLPIAFVLCIITSVATGTSWGTAGTMGIALVGVAQGLGIPLPIVVGAVISGALIGDKMSPLSDSVLLASASSETNIFDLITCMFYTTIPLSAICIVAYTLLGFKYASPASLDLEGINMLVEGIGTNFTINPLMLIPPIVVIAMSIKRIPGFLTFTAGIVSSIILGVVFQSQALNSMLHFAVKGYVSNTGIQSLDGLLSRGGALSMGQVVFATIMAGMFAGSLKNLGILDTLMTKLELVIGNSKSLIVTTVAVCLLLMLGGGGQYSALTLPGAAFGKIYRDLDVHSSVLGRTMADIATMLDPIIPWTVSGIFYSGLFGIPVASYFPFVIIGVLSPFMAIFNAFTGSGVFRVTDTIKYKPFWRRGKESVVSTVSN